MRETVGHRERWDLPRTPQTPGGPAGNTTLDLSNWPSENQQEVPLDKSWWLHLSWDDSGYWVGSRAETEANSTQQASPLSRWCCWASVILGTWGASPEAMVCFCAVTDGQTDGPPNAGWPFSLASLLWEAMRGLCAQLIRHGLSSARNAGTLHIITAEGRVCGPGSITREFCDPGRLT